MSTKAKVHRLFMNHFETVPAECEDGSFKVHTKEINQTQMRALGRLKCESVTAKRSGKGITIIVK